MRLNLHLRGIDLVDVEFHLGSRGLYLDVNVFQPRAEDAPTPPAQKADLSRTASGTYERGAGPVWEDDQPVVVRGFGFGAAAKEER
ncbi:hypothetical protein [Modestobacter sp. VKM Ac-2985]|uniref:hypothetical protein n=1 Tax=Modestobacter sp. VKM Ac-2985 TaxID=3004139 RepID=UPI0022ABBC22|nr:hypothetical protein [Modestobacter sp. VKM Ac-2985]MCZ2837152.1 hypothetical protein [Modestobacter sp. VKM Ac-2985]